MARIHLTLLSVLLYCVTYIYAAATVNSIAGPVAQGATVYITYQFSTPPAGKVTLQVINFTSKDTKFLSEDLPINPASFKWVVDVPVGTYYLAINDGSGQAFSGNFDSRRSSRRNVPYGLKT
ncbi:8671_t:CDS:2 [Entrophospora sp. SA101]|nr:11351_t:CDS:2 [Entrophospora candida]CAH1757842.1 11840_t:CDS:2 [Entrophospora sp. SA101]CAG8506052.1 14450_t:CDS:2 [Entrophospora candida]CAJ0746362.1 8671_t:CDS:2 [Entrophospora sp. SA101]CAJ0826953.1 19551_t:CDS:2 [Entrophospora sp. SA101]